MDAKDAVRLAKSYIADMFDSEDISEVGLEEIERDEASGEWLVTIGFRRPWERSRWKDGGIMATLAPFDLGNRWYKQVRIDGNRGVALAIRDRELKSAA